VDLTEQAEEMLESLLFALRDNPQGAVAVSELREQSPAAAAELEAAGLVTRHEEKLALTETGRAEAEDVLRRHRLAERLLVDVLDVKDELVHDAACRFEHIIRKGIDDHVCTLLGHPRVCPHGKPIPPGPCCQEKRAATSGVVTSLAEMAAETTGRIAYIHTNERATLEKLIAMGALPGAPVEVVQTFPSFLFQVGQTQVAVDRAIAEHIYVRLDPEESPARGPRRRLRGGRRRPL
jgi:DtxR family Mn-dependent transcriptional regulator